MMMTRLVLVSAAAITMLAPVLRAHDMGQLETTIRLDGCGSYQIEMPVDPDALLTKLEVFTQGPLSGRLSREERDRRITQLRRTFLARVQITFDGVAAQPVFHYQSYDASEASGAEPALVRLAGRAPDKAATLVFSDGLTMGTYGLRVVVSDRTASLIYLSNGEKSPAITLPRESRQPAGTSTVHTVAWSMTLTAMFAVALSLRLRSRERL